MNQEQALNVLVQAVQVAQSKGAYSLQEASIIATAVGLFTKKEEDLDASVGKDDEPKEEKKVKEK